MEMTFGLGWLVIIGIVFFLVLYFVIKWGVAAGILHAEELRKRDAEDENVRTREGKPPPGESGKSS